MNSHEQHRIRTLWVSGVLHAFTHLYQVALMPLYLLIQKDLHCETISQATLLLTVMMAGYFVPSYPMGMLADKLNRKKLLGFGLAINALGFVALALAPNYGCALAAVALAGFGGSFYHPAATAMVARLFPATTGKALGLVGIGASVGFFAGPLYAGWRAGALQPVLGAAAWRRPVLELGALGILAAVAFAWLADNEKPLPPGERKSVHHEKLFPSPVLWCFFFACAFAFSLRDFTGMSMGSLGSLFLQNAHGYDPKWTGVALSGIYLASAISNPIFGSLSDRGRHRWTMLVLCLAAALVLLLPHVPARWTVPIFLIYGFFFMSSYPMVEAALMESVPDAVRGRVFGLFITVGGLVGNLSHWIMGAQVKRLGPAAYSPGGYFAIYGALALMLVLSLAGLPCLHAIRKREARTEPSAPPELPQNIQSARLR
jgi:MFS family permease